MIDNSLNEVTSHVVGNYVVRMLRRAVRSGPGQGFSDQEVERMGYVCDLMGRDGKSVDDTDLPCIGWFGPGERFATPGPYVRGEWPQLVR